MNWLRFAMLLTTSAMVAACTLASGWTDLQGGKVDSGLEPAETPPGTGTKDADTSDRTVPGDASTTIGVPCGAQTCTGANGCCIKLGEAARSCIDHDTCNPGATKRFFLCTHGGQCPSTAPQCCLQFPEWGSSCQNGCKSGSDLLCDPANPRCPTDTTCLLFSSTPDIYSCQ